MAETVNSGIPVPAVPKLSRPTKSVKGRKVAARPMAPAANKNDVPRRMLRKVGSGRKAKVPVGKKRA